MIDHDRTVAEAEACLAELEGEARALKRQIEAWRESLDAAEKRLLALVGDRWRGGGMIGKASSDLDRSRRARDFVGTPEAVWTTPPGCGRSTYYIQKITNKRIFLVSGPGSRAEIYERATGYHIGAYGSSWGQLDVAACEAALAEARAK